MTATAIKASNTELSSRTHRSAVKPKISLPANVYIDDISISLSLYLSDRRWHQISSTYCHDITTTTPLSIRQPNLPISIISLSWFAIIYFYQKKTQNGTLKNEKKTIIIIIDLFCVCACASVCVYLFILVLWASERISVFLLVFIRVSVCAWLCADFNDQRLTIIDQLSIISNVAFSNLLLHDYMYIDVMIWGGIQVRYNDV